MAGSSQQTLKFTRVMYVLLLFSDRLHLEQDDDCLCGALCE